MAMKQPGTDYGEKGETGEREPKGATASDRTGEKRVGTPKADSEKGTAGESGEREPKGAKASDGSGERGAKITGGVGMGMHDKLTGRSDAPGGYDRGEMNTGRKEGSVYSHNRKSYQ